MEMWKWGKGRGLVQELALSMVFLSAIMHA